MRLVPLYYGLRSLFAQLIQLKLQCISVSAFMFLFINIDSIPVYENSHVIDATNRKQEHKMKWHSNCTLNAAEM